MPSDDDIDLSFMGDHHAIFGTRDEISRAIYSKFREAFTEHEAAALAQHVNNDRLAERLVAQAKLAEEKKIWERTNVYNPFGYVLRIVKKEPLNPDRGLMPWFIYWERNKLLPWERNPASTKPAHQVFKALPKKSSSSTFLGQLDEFHRLPAEHQANLMAQSLEYMKGAGLDAADDVRVRTYAVTFWRSGRFKLP